MEEIYEPYLMQIGFLERTPRGRRITARACEHLGLPAPGRHHARPLRSSTPGAITLTPAAARPYNRNQAERAFEKGSP